MNKVQKYVLYAIAGFYLLHFLRDILQDLDVHIFFTDLMVKSDKSNTPVWYWQIFNTYLIELFGLGSALAALISNRFKPFGFLSASIFILFLVIWLYYWLYL
jgi:hypothetical protein